MCDVGDIILIDAYRHKEHILSKHSFVVLGIESDKIEGLDYDFVCNVLSSFKNEMQRTKKLSYPGNFEITHTDSSVINSNLKDGYAKAEQLYYFSSAKTDFTVIGKLHADVFNRLVEFIQTLEVPLEHITDNL
ncbi:MAG: hypothetical protein FWB96_02615 [Defluviitaleaceae bacterium]|nr:hypothetical protein [Defluviitaleaceae bacterium]MCL2263860.1 hypothetical protein [Defluviitaleaceae bacterium]